MKKSVVILIAIIYIAAIAVVSFFGLQFKVFDEVVPVSSIEITNKDLKMTDEGVPYAVISADKNGERKFLIEYRVKPDNASDLGVRFAYDQTATNVTVDERGLVTFTSPGYIKISVIATDGTNTEAQIIIVAK